MNNSGSASMTSLLCEQGNVRFPSCNGLLPRCNCYPHEATMTWRPPRGWGKGQLFLESLCKGFWYLKWARIPTGAWGLDHFSKKLNNEIVENDEFRYPNLILRHTAVAISSEYHAISQPTLHFARWVGRDKFGIQLLWSNNKRNYAFGFGRVFVNKNTSDGLGCFGFLKIKQHSGHICCQIAAVSGIPTGNIAPKIPTKPAWKPHELLSRKLRSIAPGKWWSENDPFL